MAAGEFKELSDAERRKAARAEGPAAVLGIGTAVPPHAYPQSDYPDFFFGVTGCEHKTELKQKFARICAKSGINKRYMYITREVLRDNPGMASYMDPSLDARQEIAVREVPKLAAEASRKAIQEWGRPKSDITHVVMGTTSGVTMPGAEVRLVKLLGLRPHTKRVMMYQQGCFAGATVVRVAKDLAENNAGARVLAVTSELTVVTFRAPSEDHLDGLVGSALFGDGAAAVVIGSDPRPDLLERPIFELAWTGETLLPDSDGAIEGKLTEAGLIFHLMRDVPGIISKNIDKFLSLAVTQTGLNHRSNSNRPVGLTAEGALSFDDMFWVVHPGGPAILDQIEKKLKLSADKLAGTRETLADYGNMSSCSVIFALDRMRHRSKELGRATTGEGCKWGFLIAFGPGLTFEVSVLKSCPI